MWRRVAKYVLWKAEEKCEDQGVWGLPFRVKFCNDEYLFGGVMWTDKTITGFFQ